MQGLFGIFGPSLELSPTHGDALHCKLEQLREGSKLSKPCDVWKSVSYPGRSSTVECLFPISGLGSVFTSCWQTSTKWGRGSPYPHLHPCWQLEAVVSVLMKQYRKHHWIEFSCEPWPPNRGKRGPLKKKTAGFWFQDLNTAITRYSSVSAQGTTCGEQLCPVRLKRGRDGWFPG